MESAQPAGCAKGRPFNSSFVKRLRSEASSGAQERRSSLVGRKEHMAYGLWSIACP